MGRAAALGRGENNDCGNVLEDGIGLARRGRLFSAADRRRVLLQRAALTSIQKRK